MAEIKILFGAPIFWMKRYNNAPRKISSSVSTDLKSHQKACKTAPVEMFLFKTQVDDFK